MKRLTAFLLSITMLFSLAACSSQETVESTSETETDTLISETSDDVSNTDQPISEGFILIEGGTFEMGSPESEAWRSEDEIQHSVTVSDFYMSAYEVTQREYQDIMGENPSNFSGENLPVEQISWLDAVTYCNARSEQEDLLRCIRLMGTV